MNNNTKQATVKQELQELLAQAGALQDYVAIYVPSTMHIDQAVDNTKELDKVIGELSSKYGGCTCTKAQGAWYSPTRQGIVREEVTIVRSNIAQATADDFEFMKRLALDLKDAMKQESVTVEINGNMVFF